MPVDPSIALQTTVPNPANFISSFLDLGQKKLNLDKSRQTFDADVAQRQAESARAGTEASYAAQTLPSRVAQQAAQTGMDQFKLTGAQAQQSMQLASGLISDPDFSSSKPNSAGMTEKLNGAYDTMTKQFGIDPKIADANITTLKFMAIHSPGQVRQALINMTQQQQGGQGQQAAALPAPAMVPSAGGAQPTAMGNPALTGVPPGTPQGAVVPPPNQVMTDTTGAPVLANPGTGTVRPLSPVAGSGQAPPQTSLPPGETTQTQQSLQAERDAAKGVALNAPQMHDINRSIVQEVDKGITTGALGQLKQKLASATGYNLGSEGGTDYNVLGKMLERSALTAAQGMGPHTNAGLEAQVRANGSVDYTPAAIRKIANLNDALTTGAGLYQQGVESAIQQGGSVFAKRAFDQRWASAMNPAGGVNGVQALRLKNAVDNGDDKEKESVLAEVGGAKSPKAAALLFKLKQIQSLTGQ